MYDVTFDEGSIVYRETITEPVIGIGHFEPLRHYAEVHLLMEPGERGSGITLATACSTDELDLNWQRLILTHLAEKAHLGVLTGAPLTDVHITHPPDAPTSSIPKAVTSVKRPTVLCATV